jgi:transposase
MPEPAPVFQSFVGVDLHKTTVTLAAVDPAGETLARLTCHTKCVERIDRWLAELQGPVHMAVEAVTFAEWFIDRFGPSVEACGGKIDIAHATALANLRGKRRKTDRNDAMDVAVRLARGDCPLGWIADPEVMQLRKLGRHWRSLSRTLSRTKHGVRSMLNAANLAGPTLNGPAMHKWLLAHGELLKPAQRLAFEDLLDIVLLLERKRERLKREIIAANRSERFDALTTLLRTVPGIDQIAACVIAAEVGDFGRFPNADALEFWAGLTPDNLESAGRVTSGGITKAGSAALRWTLGQSAMCLCRSDAKLEARRQRLIRTRGKPRANVALARHLLRILYAMTRDGTTYERGNSGGEATNHAAQANRVRLSKPTSRSKQAA